MEQISSELNYSPSVSNHSSVIYRNVSPQGSTSLTLSSGSLSGPVEFVLSSSAFRLGQSRLNFQVNVAAGSTGHNYINANTTSLIGRMVVYDAATSNILMDVSNFEKYGQLITPMCTPATELASKAQATIIAPAASIGSIGPQDTSPESTFNPVEDLAKSNCAFTATQIDSQGQIQPDGGAAIGAPINRLAGYSNQFVGKREFYNGSVTSINFLDVSLPLSALKMTLASIDKVLYSPSSLIVQIYFNATDQFGFSTTTASNSIITAVTSLNTTVIQNINMSLACEANLAIVSQVINKVMTGGGISLPIPYTSVVRQTLAQGAQHSYQLQLTAGYGKRILFIASAPFQPVGTGGTAYPATNATAISHNNFHPRGTLTSYNTFLNSVPISNPAGYDCLKGQDWSIANKKFLERSCIQTSGEYLYSNWVHVDSWVGNRSLCDLDPTAIDGLDVSTQSATYQWQANFTAGGSTINASGAEATWVNVIVGQKTANFTAQGVTVN
jgi:hypothetical protein